MAHADWHPVSRKHVCPICGKGDNCSVTADGRMAYCGRIESGSLKQNAGGQFLHRLADDNPYRGHEHPSHRPSNPPPRKSDPKPKRSVDWGALMRFVTDRSDISERRNELAKQLGVSMTSIERIGVGWSDKQNAWMIPERDSSAKIIGISRRYRDGRKRQFPGSSRGLTFAFDWLHDPGPVFPVEGASDVAAMLSRGLCAVGRPSNVGGIELLIDLLRMIDPERRVVVLGENDQRPHDTLKRAVRERHPPNCPSCSICWPGHFGAFSTARKLCEALSRPIDVAFPPTEFKDVRNMLLKLEGVS